MHQQTGNKPACVAGSGAQSGANVSARVIPGKLESFLLQTPTLNPNAETLLSIQQDHMPLIVCNHLRGEIYVPLL